MRDPDRNIPKPEPEQPRRFFQVIRPRAAEFAALLCQQPADLDRWLTARWTVEAKVITQGPALVLGAEAAAGLQDRHNLVGEHG